MLKASNLFALLIVVVLAGVVIKAQPKAPRIEKNIQVFMDDDGSYLGVQTEEVTKENFGKFGLKEVRGVAVEKVLDNSPAKQAGLQDGDVIVRFNGEEITGYRKLNRLIGETAPDHQARLTVVRGGNEREITVTIGKRPAPKFEMGNFQMRMPEGAPQIFERAIPFPQFNMKEMPDGSNSDVFVWRGDGEKGNFVFSSTRQIGVGISSLTKQLGDYFGVADGNGVLINSVNENSPAAKAGLKAGDVIVEIEGKKVNNTVDLLRGIAEKKEGDVSLTIVRNRSRQTVTVTPEKVKLEEHPLKVMGQSGAEALPVVPRVRAITATPKMRVAAPVRVKPIL